MNVTIGISAYNEEKNIGNLLNAIKDYPFEKIVVASGCTDNTVKIAKSFNGVKVIEEKTRNGKASAVNEIIHNAKGDVIILESADTIPSSFCFKYLLKPLEDDSKVGMVGAHPIPVNRLDTSINKIGNLLWKAHHQMALKYPKAGEVVAFRNKIDGIDPKTAVDEAYIEYKLVQFGYKIEYAPNAIVFNKSPETKEDFVKQRERIFIGHVNLWKLGYTVHTIRIRDVVMASIKASKNPFLLIKGGLLEIEVRYNAKKLIAKGYNPTVWDMIKTTKSVVS
jgi:poly-beta-1,6-N-acetyl-D-glucosamine synthase